MKNLKLFTLVLFALFISCTIITPVAQAESTDTDKSYWVSIGAKHSKASGAYGTRIGNMGWEIGFSDTGDYSSSEVDDAKPFHSSTSLGEKKIGPSYGIDILSFMPASENLSLYVGAGVYYQEYRHVARDVFKDLYTESKRETADFAYSGGMHLNISDNQMLGIGYHSIRGTNVQFTVLF